MLHLPKMQREIQEGTTLTCTHTEIRTRSQSFCACEVSSDSSSVLQQSQVNSKTFKAVSKQIMEVESTISKCKETWLDNGDPSMLTTPCSINPLRTQVEDERQKTPLQQVVHRTTHTNCVRSTTQPPCEQASCLSQNNHHSSIV